MKTLPFPRSHRNQGSALMIALTFAAVLVAISSASFFIVQRKYRLVHQAASWHEALLSAEAGIELALNEIRRPLYDPNGVPFADWETDTSTHTLRHSPRELVRTGEGGTSSYCKVTVDEPSFLSRHDEQFYRVRSTGITEVTGGAIVTGERADRHLRLFSLRANNRAAAGDAPLTRPEARRRVEAIVKPVHGFRLALFGVKRIDLDDHNIVVDSYDSRSAEHSTLGDTDPVTGTVIQEGKYIRSERKENGDIATNGKVINAGDAYIYGDASTNGGTAGEDGVLNADNVTGDTRSDFYQQVLPVLRPVVTATPGTPPVIVGNTVVQATEVEPVQVILPSIILTGNDGLRIRGARTADDRPQLDAQGKYVETFAQIIVDGDINLSGNGGLVVDEGVYVRIFVRGNAYITGNGVTNPNAPLHLQIYGIDPDPALSSVGEKTIHISGNGGFSGAVYAPRYNVEMVGGGDADTIYGSFVGNTVKMSGVQSVHYDEALADGGLITDYKVVSWFEEDR
jgi:hypothetical protein